MLFELFALDVLPIGAVRYPDYGPATIVAAALGAGAPWELASASRGRSGSGLGDRRAGACSWSGGWNAEAVQHHAAALAAGESSAIRRLQYGGIFRDVLRGAASRPRASRWPGLVRRDLPMDRRHRGWR